MDYLYSATGLAAGIMDIDGTILTRTGWTDLCADFHRNHPVTNSRCIESAHQIPQLIEISDWKRKKYILYRCANGLMHAAAPIIIEDHVVATVYKTQFFISEPDMDFFKDKEIRNAIQNGEMFLVYQPQVNSRTGKIEGLEALLRWNHPKVGMITPAEFIPYAEETGFIITIGEWVLREACEQNKIWQNKRYARVPISVNISALQLQHVGFINTIKDILRETGLEPQYLELEITESRLMESIQINVDTLNKLREMGVNIALDDFGTGYSSLNYLQKLPINNLKIDKSFIENLTADLNKRYILEVIISLAQKMNLKVTAEGVETLEQYRILKEQKCDKIQGYLMSKPLMPNDIEPILKKGFLEPASIFV